MLDYPARPEVVAARVLGEGRALRSDAREGETSALALPLGIDPQPEGMVLATAGERARSPSEPRAAVDAQHRARLRARRPSRAHRRSAPPVSWRAPAPKTRRPRERGPAPRA